MYWGREAHSKNFEEGAHCANFEQEARCNNWEREALCMYSDLAAGLHSRRQGEYWRAPRWAKAAVPCFSIWQGCGQTISLKGFWPG